MEIKKTISENLRKDIYSFLKEYNVTRKDENRFYSWKNVENIVGIDLYACIYKYDVDNLRYTRRLDPVKVKIVAAKYNDNMGDSPVGLIPYKKNGELSKRMISPVCSSSQYGCYDNNVLLFKTKEECLDYAELRLNEIKKELDNEKRRMISKYNETIESIDKDLENDKKYFEKK